MTAGSESPFAASDLPEVVRKIRLRTPARLLAGRAGAAYRTSTQIELREAHAAARDAVRAELDVSRIVGPDLLARFQAIEVSTQAKDKHEYLLRPDLGRRFDDRSRTAILAHSSQANDLQIAVGDGLSVSAVEAQTPALLPLLFDGALARGWKIGCVLMIRHCRVGVLNEIGELLNPEVVVLLIGERPGLATAESLSAYMAYRPRRSHTDADRNLISNIHRRGLSPETAAARILNFVAQMMRVRMSGSTVREPWLALELGGRESP